MKCFRRRLPAGMIVTTAVVLLGVESVIASDISVFPDTSVIWQVINFVVLIWAMNLVLYKPIRNIISRRKEQISGLDSHINKYLQDTADKENALTEGLKTARADGTDKKNALIDSAEAEEKAIIEDIYKSTQQNIAEDKARIAREAEKAAADLQREVDAFAAEIGQKILGRKVA